MEATKQTTTSHTKAQAKVKKCDCKHALQDEIHGSGMRCKNPCKDGYRCTVCGKVDK